MSQQRAAQQKGKPNAKGYPTMLLENRDPCGRGPGYGLDTGNFTLGPPGYPSTPHFASSLPRGRSQVQQVRDEFSQLRRAISRQTLLVQ